MALTQEKREQALRKELLAVMKLEKKLEKTALETRPAGWKTALEQKVPGKVYGTLQSAFAKAFETVFSKGRSIIEKSYRKDTILEDQSIREYAVRVKGGRKQLRQIRRKAQGADLRNLAFTTVSGVGLGAFGIGLPDIVLFISTLLKGVYETALNYGYDYTSRSEQILILKMMAGALSTGADWKRISDEVDDLMGGDACDTSDEAFRAQMEATSSAFAVDMLLLKFIQGTAIVGIIGGAANPVYYRKVMRYVQMKYRKRYLWKMSAELYRMKKNTN